MAFYNTTQLSGEDLRKAVERAKNQDEAILTIYKNCRKPFSASQILKLTTKAGKQWPLTSVRRSITNLCNAGHLVKNMEKVTGMYGDPEHTWEINAVKYPTVQANQPKLFNDAA